MLPTRNVKYILESTLRRIQEQTGFAPAPDNAIQDLFNIYIDMLLEFQYDGYLGTSYVIPETINDNISYEIPHSDLIAILVRKAADYWAFQLPFSLASLASKSSERIATRLCVPKIASNPIPANYRYFDYPSGYYSDCCTNQDDEPCDTVIVSNDNEVLVAGT